MAGNKSKDIYIALMGPIGAGKSTFISHCTDQQADIGDHLRSCTQDIAVYPFSYSPDITVHLVDTPGFDDTNRSNTDVLRSISAWLTESYDKRILLDGILYFHRISDVRMTGSGKLNIMLLLKLCGKDWMKKVLLTTTMWEQVEISLAESREKELEENEEAWGFMRRHGSSMRRHYNIKESALSIISMFVPESADQKIEAMALALQKELVIEHRTPSQTSASQSLDQAKATDISNLQQEIDGFREAMKKATANYDAHNDSLIEEHHEKQSRWFETMQLEQERWRASMEQRLATGVSKTQEGHNALDQRPATMQLRVQSSGTLEVPQRPETNPGLRTRSLSEGPSSQQRMDNVDLAAKTCPESPCLPPRPKSAVPNDSRESQSSTTTKEATRTEGEQEEGDEATSENAKPKLDFTLSHEISGDLGDIPVVLFSSNDKRLFATANKQQIWVWNRGEDELWQHEQTLMCKKTSKVGKALGLDKLATAIESMVLGPKDDFLAIGGMDEYLRTYKMDDLGQIEQAVCLKTKYAAWRLGVGRLALSPSGKLLLSASWLSANNILVWRVESAQSVTHLHTCEVSTISNNPKGNSVKSMEFARDGRLALGLKTEVILCSVDETKGTLTTLQVLSTNYQVPMSLAWTSDGERLASVGEYWDWSVIQLWKLRSQARPEMRLEAEFPQDGICTQAKFSPDGQLLAVARKDGVVRIMMRDEKAEKGWTAAADVGTAGTAGSTVRTSVAFQSDGRYIAVGGRDAIRIWTLAKADDSLSVADAGDRRSSLRAVVHDASE